MMSHTYKLRTLKAGEKSSNTFSIFIYFLTLHPPYLSDLAELWSLTQFCPTGNAGPPSGSGSQESSLAIWALKSLSST